MAASESRTESASLAERLRARIRREGAISFHDWMQSALYDPAEGYYFRADRVRWGRAGDYRTAPETSPLFAATFARYFARLYVELGSPSNWTLFEAGAGAGDFAEQVLKSLRQQHPQAFDTVRYVIDERSSSTRERIEQKVSPFCDRLEFDSLPETEGQISGIVFSNELLDAFPVHRIVMRDGRLRELCVGLSDEEAFIWKECEPTTPRLTEYLSGIDASPAEGQILEVNLAAGDWIARATAFLAQGFVISVDYGSDRKELLAPHRREGTLRAFHHHRLADHTLANPGEQDLTTTVDWTQIEDAGKSAGLETVRFERLDQFLLKEGLLEELETLAAGRDDVEAIRLRTSAREMIMPDALASAFQVLVQEKKF